MYVYIHYIHPIHPIYTYIGLNVCIYVHIGYIHTFRSMYVDIGSIIYIRYIHMFRSHTVIQREIYICICIDLNRTQSYRERDVFISILTPIPVYVCIVIMLSDMGWLRLVGCLKIYISLQNIGLFCRSLLQKRPIFLSILLIVATT